MIIITGNSHPELAHTIATRLSIPFIRANTKKFEDQELRIQIDGTLYEQDVVIIQSTSKPANDNLMELLLLIDTAKRAVAKRITVVIPYFGYSRQDRPSYTYGPISASLVATLIEAAGADRIITLDLHSRQIEGFFHVGVKNMEILSLFVPIFPDVHDCIVVSPDVGGLCRAQKFASMLGVNLAVINKSRAINGECSVSEVIGDVNGKKCIIIDDIIDTGNTLCLASDLLIKRGATSVTACATHGVFSSKCIDKILASSISDVYVTDSIKQTTFPDKIKLLTVSQVLANAISQVIML